MLEWRATSSPSVPGWAKARATQRFVTAFVDRATMPLVIDADGLNAFTERPDRLAGREGRDVIITPHPGEMARLVGMSTDEVQASRLEIARNFAVAHHVYVVLKGHRTLVATPDGRVFINPTGNPGMATGGTGDVLTGMIAAWLAQLLDAEAACKLAVYLHGMAGDLAEADEGEVAMTSIDLAGHLGDADSRAHRAAESRRTQPGIRLKPHDRDPPHAIRTGNDCRGPRAGGATRRLGRSSCSLAISAQGRRRSFGGWPKAWPSSGDQVNSPTFTILQEYRGGRLPLFHADLYRLNDAREVEDLGLDEISAGGVLAIEWAGQAGSRAARRRAGHDRSRRGHRCDDADHDAECRCRMQSVNAGMNATFRFVITFVHLILRIITPIGSSVLPS